MPVHQRVVHPALPSFWVRIHIYVPYQKELFFFDFNYHRGIEWYSHFFKQNDSSFIGDATPWYMSWNSVPERIAKHFPDARIVFILREPSARAWSHYWMDYSSLRIEMDLSPQEYFLRLPTLEGFAAAVSIIAT